MVRSSLRAAACTTLAAGALILAWFAAPAAGALDLDDLGLPVTPPSQPIDLVAIDLSLTPSTTAAPTTSAPPPAGEPAVAGLPAPPSIPSPGVLPDGLLPTGPEPGGGGAGESELIDPCAQITEPVAAQGAPIAASCPITPTADDGVDVTICVDIALVATCKQTASVTTTTISGPGGPGTGAAGSNPSRDATASPTGARPNAPDSTDVRGTGETLPLTGSAIVWLLTIGTALAAAGGALARVARRRIS